MERGARGIFGKIVPITGRSYGIGQAIARDPVSLTHHPDDAHAGREGAPG